MSEQLTVFFPVRITPSLHRAISAQSNLLGIRPVDFGRLALAIAAQRGLDFAEPEKIEEKRKETREDG